MNVHFPGQMAAASLIALAGPALPTSALAQSIPPLERAGGACIACAMDGWFVLQPSPDVITGNGCATGASGGTGPMGLLGALGLVILRRRRP